MKRARPGALRVGGLLAGAALALGCDDSTAPRTRAVTVCDSSPWLAYQNEGSGWVHLEPRAGGYTFQATERLAFARGRFQQYPPANDVRVDWLTAEQLAARFACVEGTPGPGGHIGGAIAGLSDFRWASVYVNGIGAYVPTGGSSWQMEAQPVPATLVAVRYDSGTGSVAANRLIVRRDQSYLPGAPVPLLDFDADESFAPQASTVSFTGPPGYATVYFLAAGKEAFISSYPAQPSTTGDAARSAPFYTVPAARLAPGDIHSLAVQAGGRSARRWVRVGSDQAMTIGPEIAAPSIITIAATPYRRVRVELPSQPEYGASVDVRLGQYVQSPERYTRLELAATREYFGGTPAVWSLTLPDFSGVAGFQPWGMLEAGEISWNLSGTNQRFGLTALNAQDGETSLYAWRTGSSP